MRASISLGRIAGIKVGVNASVFLILAILVGGLATGQLPAAFPGHSVAAYVIAAIIAAVLFWHRCWLTSWRTSVVRAATASRSTASCSGSLVAWPSSGASRRPRRGLPHRGCRPADKLGVGCRLWTRCSRGCTAGRRWADVRCVGLPRRNQWDACDFQPHPGRTAGRWSSVARRVVAVAR